MSLDEKYMARCLQLAALGKGNVAPNPMVGAVIVCEDKIIGEGYHQKFGEAHAEVNAVNSVEDKSLLPFSTIYVSLEPCAHFGKTPPCADLLVRSNFKRVVIGVLDAHAKVYKKGVQRIIDAGIDVTVGVLENECKEINRAFFTFHEKKRPYVVLKWAQTTNGLIDNSDGNLGEVSWISAPETQVKVHQWRSEFQAILVGKNTVIQDNPSLTVRAVEGNQPIRVVLDGNLALSAESAVFNEESPSIVINLIKNNESGQPSYVQVKEMSVSAILEALYQHSIQSVMVEGGASVSQSFIDSDLWDEARIITGKNRFSSGTAAPKIEGQLHHEEPFFGDRIAYIWNR